MKTLNHFVQNQKEFESLCARLQKASSIAIDTEFVRRTTYYPKLSLIQVAFLNETYVIDVLGLDLSSFKAILIDEKILKIFHSPKQDFEIFYKLFKILPKNIFDVQIAARFCGFKAAVGYAELCQEICSVILDKTHQAGDWLMRPIADSMIAYASNDVKYLHSIYDYFAKKLEKIKEYKEAISAELLDPAIYEVNLLNAWKKVKFNKYSPEITSRMQILAAFREKCASELDIPRRHFIPDEHLAKICRYLPSSQLELRDLKIGASVMTRELEERLFNLCAELKHNTK